MQNPPARRLRDSQALGRALAYLAIAIGVVSLLGWTMGLPESHPAASPQLWGKPAADLWLIALGAALSLRQAGFLGKWTVWPARALTAGVFVTAMAVALEYALGRSLGLDAWLSLGLSASRPGILATLAMILLSAGVGSLDCAESSPVFLNEAAALAAFMLPYSGLLGWIYDLSIKGLATTPPPFSLPAVLGTIGLCGSLLLTCPGRGLVSLWLSDTPGSALIRRLGPPLLALPPVIGLVRLLGERAGWDSASHGLDFFVLAFTLSGAALLGWCVQTVNWLSATAESVTDALISTDLGGRITGWNPGATRIFGYEAEEVKGQSLAFLVPPEREHELPANLARLRQGESIESFDTVRLRKDGGRVDVAVSIIPVRDLLGRVIGTSAIAQDISGRKATERALRENEAKFRGMLEAAPDAVLLIDDADRVVLVNSQAETLFGYPREKLLGLAVDCLVPSRRREEHARHVRDFWSDPRPRTLGDELDLLALHRDGREIPVEIGLSPIQLPQGQLLIASIRDLTPRREAMRAAADRTAQLKKIQELSYLKGQLLSMMSHEMKTPLSLITGYAELMEDQSPEDPMIQGIQQGVSRLTEHVNKMLDYSALISGSMPLFLAEVDLPEVVHDVLAAQQERLENRQLRLVVEEDPATPCLHADARRITQILGELMSNAEKFTPPGGTVGLRIGPADHEVRLEVWDTGQGIPAPELAHIWTGTTQLERTDSERRGGLGLGLAIVRLLVELHGGRIELQSEPGQGTRVIIHLPMAGPASSPDTAALPPG